jgi:pimeloyl-ACP methyl ester carboxylesterase
VLASGFAAGIQAQTDATTPCDVGVYRGPHGDFVTIIERPDTAQSGAWRYDFRDGHFGSTKNEVLQCVKDAVIVTRDGGPPQKWPKVQLKLTPTRFRSGDAMLAGLLIEPTDAEDAKPPLVVCVHGSESTASIRRNRYPYVFAAQGISAFVFDKRGAGASEGKYNQNFHKLAADAVAASTEAKRLAKGRYSRFDLFGGSQGGWVAPRAANDAGADFVAIGFGLLLNPLEEDSEQVSTELRGQGYADDVIAKAREVTDATAAVMASHFENGYDKLAAVKARFGAKPWFSKLKGEFTGDILASDEATLRREGRAKYDNLDIDWHYDAVAELRKVKAPQLWIVAGQIARRHRI